MAKAVVRAEPSEKEEDLGVPAVEVLSKGRISQSLEFLAKAYEARFQDVEDPKDARKTRWVYSPLHKPELSNVIGRRMDGWRPILASELPESIEMLGLKEDEMVRHGDVVLMWTTEKNRAKLRKEIDDKTREQAEGIDKQHYESVKGIRSDDPRMGPEHEVRPRGRAVIEEKEFEFEYTQKDATEKEE